MRGIPDHDRDDAVMRCPSRPFIDRATDNPGAGKRSRIPEHGRAAVQDDLGLALGTDRAALDALEKAWQHREPVRGVAHQIRFEQDFRLILGAICRQTCALAQRGGEIPQRRILVRG